MDYRAVTHSRRRPGRCGLSARRHKRFYLDILRTDAIDWPAQPPLGAKRAGFIRNAGRLMAPIDGYEEWQVAAQAHIDHAGNDGGIPALMSEALRFRQTEWNKIRGYRANINARHKKNADRADRLLAASRGCALHTDGEKYGSVRARRRPALVFIWSRRR